MSLNRVPIITMYLIDFEDLIHGRTNSPIAEGEIPDILRSAIKVGFRVELTDLDGIASSRLTLSDDGKLQVVPI